MKILMLHRQPSAVGYYRTIIPARILQSLGHEVTYFPRSTYHKESRKLGLEEWLRQFLGKFDLLIVDKTLSYTEVGLMAGLRHHSPGMRMIADFDDDFMNVPKWNPSLVKFQAGQESYEAGLGHLKLSEMVTVSTETLAEEFKDRCHSIRVARNLIDPADWTGHPVDPERDRDTHLRVLYGGAAGHYGDLDVVRSGLEEMIDNPPRPWRLICAGAIPAWLHEASRRHPSRVINLPWVHFEDYPAAMAWGRFDASIAPLADHPFNDAKSQIKWLEAGIQGIPFVCSDVGPYRSIPQGAAIKTPNTHDGWAESLRAVLCYPEVREDLAVTAKAAVRSTRTIDQGREVWKSIVCEVMDRPRIETLEDALLPGEQPPAAQEA